jgi:integrase
MKNRFRLIQRGLRGGRFYCVDSQTGRRESLGTKDSDEAAQLVLAKNQSVRQPALSLQWPRLFSRPPTTPWPNAPGRKRSTPWSNPKKILQGPLFPTFSKLKEGHRSTHFRRSCRKAGVEGVSLHSYRYALAERARIAGYPERFAQEARGHNSKAVHRAYARNAQVVLPWHLRGSQSHLWPSVFRAGPYGLLQEARPVRTPSSHGPALHTPGQKCEEREQTIGDFPP